MGEGHRGRKEGHRARSGFPVLLSLSCYGLPCSSRIQEGSTTIQQALARKLDIPDLEVLRFQIAFVKGDQLEMKQIAATGRNGGQVEALLANQEALTMAYSGRLQEATFLSLRAVALAKEGAQLEQAALFEGQAALREALFGNSIEGEKHATAALNLSNGKDVQYGAAVSLP